MKNADVKAEQILVATGRLPATSGMGLTEEKTAEAGYKYKVTKLPLDQVPIALASRDTRGFI
ncbi:MAG: mercuric reductase, partial [Spirochaetes bacterium]|nr:mercuric reductase [Spirochaetota bacterium]